jgi:glycosyltransferase involved in cell wall biosynthesis
MNDRVTNIGTNRLISVCFISLNAYPLFNQQVKELFGGAEVDLYLLATELSKDRNFEVSFVVGDYGQPLVETYENITVVKSVNVKHNLFLGGWRIWKALSKANAHIYMSEASSLGTALNAFFCKCHGKKFVYRTAHEQECDGTYIQQHWFRGKAFLWALRHANTVITQNQEDVEKLLTATGVSSQVIRNAHILPSLMQQQRDTILWVARNADFKRPQLFLDLAEQFPDEKFVMICSKAWGDQNYGQLVARAKTIKNLEFFPLVPFQKISDYFRRAKVFVCTSQAEGFPNTYIHAWINAIPVLSLEVNPDGIFDKFACGICCNGDFGRLVESLRSVLTENRYIELGRNARKYAEEHHDIKKVAKEYKKLFSNIVYIDTG